MRQKSSTNPGPRWFNSGISSWQMVAICSASSTVLPLSCPAVASWGGGFHFPPLRLVFHNRTSETGRKFSKHLRWSRLFYLCTSLTLKPRSSTLICSCSFFKNIQFYMHECFAFMCTTCVQYPWCPEESIRTPLKQELQIAVNKYVEARNWTPVLWRNNQCSYLMNHLSILIKKK